MEKTIETRSLEETQKFAEEFAKKLEGSEVIALYGDLGAGKTSFVQGLARGLGIKERIISPTFIIVREHKIKNQKSKIKNQKFYHVDLYRVEDDKQIEEELRELFNAKNILIAIEWAEKIKSLLPKERIDIFFEYLSENKRRIKVLFH